MKKYRINYFFDGEGQIIIKAKTKKEAEKKFFNGDYAEEDDNEYGQNYCIENIKTE